MSNSKSLRHPTFDYRRAAAYFVTVCTHDRRHLFGRVRRGRVILNDLGQIVAYEWRRSEEIRDEVVLDAFVVMPDHFHGIVCIVPPEVDDVSPRGYNLRVGGRSNRPDTDSAGAGSGGRSASHQQKGSTNPKGPPARSLSSVMAGFKSAATKRINEHRETPGRPVWQSRYHDRIVRHEEEWRVYRKYIEQNPARWGKDR